MARFDTISYLRRVALQRENDLLERKVRANRKIISQLTHNENKEADKVANQLDKDFPEWRRVLVQELRNSDLL